LENLVKLVWNTTGDYISCDVLQPELAEYYFSNIYNSFDYSNKIIDDGVTFNLNFSLMIVNSILEKLKIEPITLINILDQNELNKVHYEWVMLHKKYPALEKIANKVDNRASLMFHNVNKSIHALEESFELVVSSVNETTVKNTFGTSVLSLGRSNVMIDFKNLGRSSYNRWLYFCSPDHDDTNDFNELGGDLVINLHRSYSLSLPPEYVKHSVSNNTPIVGDKILLANFKDLETNLTQYRELWVKNINLTNNNIFFTL